MIREWDARAYDRLSDPQFGWGLKVVERVRRLPLRGDERVLDAGCGTGRVTAELAKLFQHGRVVALDVSENMLRAAQQNLNTAAHVDFVNADMAHVPFSACFDGVFSTAAFHWVKDHEKLFTSLHDALKPGGWLVAQCGGGLNLKHLRDGSRRVEAMPRFRRFFQGWSGPWEYAGDATTTRRLRQAGFTDVHAWLEQVDVSLPGPNEYREFLRTVTLRAQIARITDERLREEYLDLLVAEASREGGYSLDYWRLNIQARRC